MLVRAAREDWQAISHPRAVQLTWVVEAELLRQSGELEASDSTMSNAGSRSMREHEGYRHEISARIAHSRLNHQLALDLATAAFAEAVTVGSRLTAIHCGTLAVECAVSAARFDLASDLSKQLERVCAHVRDYENFELTEDMRVADQHAGRAVRILSTGFGPLKARIRSAVEHLDEAIALDPEEGWFRVELGFLDLISNQVEGARSHFESAADRIGIESFATALRLYAAELVA